MAATLQLEREPRRVLRARVFEPLVAAELFLDVGRRLEDRRDDRAGGRVGLLARVNAHGREAGVGGELHKDTCRSGRGISRKESPVGAQPRCGANRAVPIVCYHSVFNWHGQQATRGHAHTGPAPAGAAEPPDAARRLGPDGARPPAEFLAGAALHHRRPPQNPRRPCPPRRRGARVPQRREHGGDGRAGVFGPLLPDQARLPRPAPAALACPAQADPLLHLHRRRAVAADSRLLSAEHGVRGGSRRGVPLPRRL